MVGIRRPAGLGACTKWQNRRAKLAALADDDTLRPVIDKVYPLDEVASAHEHIEIGHARGKIVLAVR